MVGGCEVSVVATGNRRGGWLGSSFHLMTLKCPN